MDNPCGGWSVLVNWVYFNFSDCSEQCRRRHVDCLYVVPDRVEFWQYPCSSPMVLRSRHHCLALLTRVGLDSGKRSLRLRGGRCSFAVSRSGHRKRCIPCGRHRGRLRVPRRIGRAIGHFRIHGVGCCTGPCHSGAQVWNSRIAIKSYVPVNRSGQPPQTGSGRCSTMFG